MIILKRKNYFDYNYFDIYFTIELCSQLCDNN